MWKNRKSRSGEGFLVGGDHEGNREILPAVRPKRALLACLADLHLWSKPPVARSVENDWYATQRGYLQQIKRIVKEFDTPPLGIPLVVAGDILDKWNATPELINFCIDYLPHCFAVPGQHDLPNHRIEDIKKSAFWTLVQAGKISVIGAGTPREAINNKLRLWGFPWNHPITPCPDPHDLYIEAAVVHKYIFVKGTGYHGAPEENRVGNLAKSFKGFDVVLSGDNHTHHLVKKNGIVFLNPGSMMARDTTQRDYKPAVWILFDDLSVEPRYLDISQDKWATPKEVKKLEESSRQIDDFVQELGKVSAGEGVDFDEALRRLLRKGKISPEAAAVIVAAMEKDP